MKTIKILLIVTGVIMLFAAASSKWLWSNRESAITPTLTEINRVSGVTSAVLDAARGDVRYNQILNNVDPIATGLIYSKAQVDAKITSTWAADFMYLTGINYILPVAAANLLTGSAALVSGTAYYMVYIAKESRTISSVSYSFATAQASYTGDAAKYNGIVLWRINKTTGDWTELARTTNDTEIWKGLTNTGISTNFAVAANVIAGDVLGVSFVYNYITTQTTAPTLYTFGNANYISTFLSGFRITASRTVISDFTNFNSSTFSTANICYAMWLK